MAYYGWYSGDELYHYGIPGQKWGQRRFQNPDGSLTAEGRQRYGRIAERHYRAGRALSNYAKKHSGTRLGSAAAKAAKRQVQIGNSYRNSKSQNSRDKKLQTALKVGAGVTAAALAGYGAYRLAKSDTRAGQKIRNTAINARFLAKEAGASARGLARNASEIAGRAGSRIASGARSAGIKGRYLAKELGASARGAAANASRNIGDAANRIASKARNLAIGAQMNNRYKTSKRRNRKYYG